ncbi:MAG: class I SAM-dependent methyltransferase [Promethearchaeota archaeon]
MKIKTTFVEEYWKNKSKFKIDDWTPKKEDHIVLINLIEKFNLKSFFEIGTYTAFTTELLATHPNIKRWKSIDTNPHIYHPNIIKIDSGEYIPGINCFPEGEDEQYDLIFIDGDHQNVKRDTELALRLKPIVIAWHDYKELFVQRDVDLFKPDNVEANVAWKKV